MPTYEYRCLECKRRFTLVMSYSEYGTRAPRCAHCGSEQVQRKIGRVRVARSGESRLESMADPARLAGLDDNPQELGRMMREMRSEVGEEVGPEFDEVVSRLERGQSPDQIERDLPDLGGADLSGGAGGDFD